MYGRVSTKEKGQEVQNQLRQLREFAIQSGWTIVAEYVDHESGKGSDRVEFQRMFAAASKRQFDVLLFWSLDRLSREGVLPTLQHLERLTSYGVGFRSYTEQYFDSCGIFRDESMGKQKAGSVTTRQKAAKRDKPDKRASDRNGVVDFFTGELARRLGISSRSACRLCSTRELASYRTQGGHIRVRLKDLEEYEQQRSGGDVSASAPRAEITRLSGEREQLQALNLQLQQRRVKRDLERFDEEDREAERKRAEAVAAEQARSQAALEQVRLQREQRDRQAVEDRKKQQEFERWQNWADGWIQYALVNFVSSLDGRTRFAGEIQTLVQQALERLGPLGPSRPRAIVEQVVIAATWQALEPWIREQQQKQERATTETHRLLAEVRSNAREEQADTYLRTLLPYLQELQADPNGYDFEPGEIFLCELRIKNTIRPRLIEEAPTLDYVSGPRLVRELAHEWLETSLNERPQ